MKAPSQPLMLLSRGFATLLVVGLGLGFATRSEAQSSANYYLKVGTGADFIEGEARGPQHHGEINVLAFSMSFGQPALCGNLVITKNVDKASAPLAMLAIQSAPIHQVVLTGQTLGSGLPIDFFKVTLQGVVIQSVNISDSSGVPPAIEQLALKAQFIQLEYSAVTAGGRLGARNVAAINCTQA